MRFDRPGVDRAGLVVVVEHGVDHRRPAGGRVGDQIADGVGRLVEEGLDLGLAGHRMLSCKFSGGCCLTYILEIAKLAIPNIEDVHRGSQASISPNSKPRRPRSPASAGARQRAPADGAVPTRRDGRGDRRLARRDGRAQPVRAVAASGEDARGGHRRLSPRTARRFGTGSPIRASKACSRRCTRCSAGTARACRAAVDKKGRRKMSLATISPQQAAALLKDGAIIVDIRERDEHAREHIAAGASSAAVAPRRRGTRAA